MVFLCSYSSHKQAVSVVHQTLSLSPQSALSSRLNAQRSALNAQQSSLSALCFAFQAQSYALSATHSALMALLSFLCAQRSLILSKHLLCCICFTPIIPSHVAINCLSLRLLQYSCMPERIKASSAWLPSDLQPACPCDALMTPLCSQFKNCCHISSAVDSCPDADRPNRLSISMCRLSDCVPDVLLRL